jgi:hypothetical protein
LELKLCQEKEIIMCKRISLILLVCAIFFALGSAVHAGVTTTSPNFTFTGNWPEDQPVDAGSAVTNIPMNIAAATSGGIPFAIGEYGGPHTIAHLNDSLYGNDYSWITASLNLARNVDLGGSYGTVYMSFAGIALSNATLYSISDIVFGRSAAGEHGDRIDGNIYIQITTTNSVAAITDISAAADAHWTTLGSFTTTDVYEHMFTLTPPVQATGVRIVTTAGNCIDEIVVHENIPSQIYNEPSFVWANPVGGAWSVGGNWTNNTSPNTIFDNVYMRTAPLSNKIITNNTTYGIKDGRGYQFGTLTVDSTTGDGTPLTFTGDAFYLWLSDIDVTGHLILSNAVESYSEIQLTGFGEVTMANWTPTKITQPKLHMNLGTLTIAGPTAASEGAGQADSLTLENGTTLNAASDVRTQSLNINGNAVKSGSGTLTAGQINQASGTFILNNGTLNVAGAMLSEDDPVAEIPTPWTHLDASDYASSMATTTGGDGTISVTGWSDINANGFTATAPGYSTPPTLVTNGLNGLPFVDFGALVYGSTNESHLVWNSTNGLIRTVVMVYSDSTNYTYYSGGRDQRACFLGSLQSSMYFWRGDAGSLIDKDNAANNVRYGHMAVDGKAATPDTYLPVGFHVLSFVTASSTRSEVFARDKVSWTGGPRMAEVMIWNTPLTSPQLRSIEQELMVKWLGRNRPGYPSQAPAGPASDAWMHLDASDTNSMEIVDDGGTLYVQQWNDIHSNGNHAYATETSFRPIWKEGNGFPYVDFGILSGPNYNTDMGQHLYWSETNNNVRTVFLVYSDADSGVDQNLIGSLEGMPPFNRGTNKKILSDINASSYVKDGTHSLDYGMIDAVKTPLPAGFHVVGVRTYRGRPVKGDVFARDRTSHAGGQKLAEVLVFNRDLSDGEFRQTRRYLMQKWFDADSEQESDLYHLMGNTDTKLDIDEGQTLTCQTAECPGTFEKRGAGRLIIGAGSAQSISVPDGELWLTEEFTIPGGDTLSNLTMGSGVTINLNGNALQVDTLTGSGYLSNGTITASNITLGAEGGTPEALILTGDLILSSPCVINVDAAAETMDKIDISGNLTLSAEGEVIVSIPEGTRLPLSHQLFTFSTLTSEENLTDWTVEVTQSKTYTAKLVQHANSIDLNFCMRGTVLIIK